MQEYKIEIFDKAETEIEKYIQSQLREFNLAQTEFNANYQPLTIALRNGSGEIIGGVCAKLNWGWLYIDLLWVNKTLRGQNLGAKLLLLVEEEAQKRGCKGAHLFTYSFQAPHFYIKKGYHIFAEIDNYPEGHKRIYLKKMLGNFN